MPSVTIVMTRLASEPRHWVGALSFLADGDDERLIAADQTLVFPRSALA